MFHSLSFHLPYRLNRSTEDTVSTAIHIASIHLENRDSYVQLLFNEHSSVFNSMLTSKLINKPSTTAVLPPITGRHKHTHTHAHTQTSTHVHINMNTNHY